MNASLPNKNPGLHKKSEFKDNCGFGLIAQMHGQASHDLLKTAIESLTCMTHRGGIAADGKTGDGCGLLIKKPDSFLRTLARELFDQDMHERYAVGMVFLPQDQARAQKGRQALEQQIHAQGLEVLGWRVVPTDPSVCGEIALACIPRLEQIFVNAPEGME